MTAYRDKRDGVATICYIKNRGANFGRFLKMAALEAKPLAFFIGRVYRWVFPARQFLLKRLEVDEFQSFRLRHPNWIALRVFVEQAERSCGCAIAIQGASNFAR